MSRIQICPSDPAITFRLYRKRFPIKIAFVMKIRQTQGQRPRRVEMYPQSPAFSHGLLPEDSTPVPKNAGVVYLICVCVCVCVLPCLVHLLVNVLNIRNCAVRVT
jgi:hypothetical protein